MIYNADRIKAVTINLGVQGENLANKVEIDVSSMVSKWPDGSIALLVQRSGETSPYIPLTEVKDGILEWNVTATDTAISGYGKIEIRCMDGDVIKKSVTGTTYTAKSMTEEPIDPPDPSQNWLEEVLAAGEFARKEADRAEKAADVLCGMEAEAETLPAGEKATVESIETPDGNRKILYGIPEGAPGQKGADGITPVIGENGNWFLGEEDTGKPSRGTQGEPGKDGVQGPKGDPGENAPQIDDTKASVEHPWSGAKVSQEIGRLLTLPEVTTEDSGKVPVVNADGTGYELKEGIVDTYTKAESNARFAHVIQSTVSGELICLADSAELPLKNLNIFGKTTQDGTPTPETPVPLVSVGDSGNVKITVIRSSIWDGQWKNGYYNASNGEYVSAASVWCSKNPIPVVPSQSYFGRYFPNNVENPLFIQMYDRNMGFIKQITVNNSTFKTESNCYFINFNVKVGSEPYNNDLVINFGTSAIPWEPYQSQTITIPTPDGLPGIQVDSGGTYTDSTGKQWVCNSIEGGNGKWEYVKRIMVKKSPMALRFSGYGTSGYYKAISTVQANERCVNSGSNSKCNYFKTMYSADKDDVYFYISGASVVFYTNQWNTLEEFNAWVQEKERIGNPVVIMGILETPVRTPITDSELIAELDALHTYEGTTNLFTTDDAGQSVTYIADTKKYIDNMLSAVMNRMLALENETLNNI